MHVHHCTDAEYISRVLSARGMSGNEYCHELLEGMLRVDYGKVVFGEQAMIILYDTGSCAGCRRCLLHRLQCCSHTVNCDLDPHLHRKNCQYGDPSHDSGVIFCPKWYCILYLGAVGRNINVIQK